ncbi:hypothetical protein [Streptosporangium carneum]|uniref:Uncharacterized protein n=1 Tax=Streptosporangium carneum TaxID=47481 RepID=A0A9W6I6H5_9ACTN|nr:hypothetical protein [Streptosporangium carneum]GLK12946.1 hypothetical protein GCM10017600_63560 [Streptosporangium carneum]
MTITESDLRDLFHEDAETPPAGGVTVAGVDRRIGAIRRRRLRLLGGTALAGLAAAAALTLPGAGTVSAPDDVWNGVMAQPSPRYGAREMSKVVVDEAFSAMGRRVAFGIPKSRGAGDLLGMVYCPRGAEMLYWLDGVYRNALLCNERLPAAGGPVFGIAVTVTSGTRRLEVAALPPGTIRKLGRPAVTDGDRRRLLELAGDGRADMRVRVDDVWIESCDSGPRCRFADEPVPPRPQGVTASPDAAASGGG